MSRRRNLDGETEFEEESSNGAVDDAISSKNYHIVMKSRKNIKNKNKNAPSQDTRKGEYFFHDERSRRNNKSSSSCSNRLSSQNRGEIERWTHDKFEEICLLESRTSSDRNPRTGKQQQNAMASTVKTSSDDIHRPRGEATQVVANELPHLDIKRTKVSRLNSLSYEKPLGVDPLRDQDPIPFNRGRSGSAVEAEHSIQSSFPPGFEKVQAPSGNNKENSVLILRAKAAEFHPSGSAVETQLQPLASPPPEVVTPTLSAKATSHGYDNQVTSGQGLVRSGSRSSDSMKAERRVASDTHAYGAGYGSNVQIERYRASTNYHSARDFQYAESSQSMLNQQRHDSLEIVELDGPMAPIGFTGDHIVQYPDTEYLHQQMLPHMDLAGSGHYSDQFTYRDHENGWYEYSGGMSSDLGWGESEVNLSHDQFYLAHLSPPYDLRWE